MKKISLYEKPPGIYFSDPGLRTQVYNAAELIRTVREVEIHQTWRKSIPLDTPHGLKHYRPVIRYYKGVVVYPPPLSPGYSDTLDDDDEDFVLAFAEGNA